MTEDAKQRGGMRKTELKDFSGQTISWELKNGVIEVALHREPCNEIGMQSLEELEQFVSALPALEETAHALKKLRMRLSFTASKFPGSALAAICASCITACREWRRKRRLPGSEVFTSAFIM